MMSHCSDLAMCGREAVIETMRILMTAECQNEGSLKNEPLYIYFKPNGES